MISDANEEWTIKDATNALKYLLNPRQVMEVSAAHEECVQRLLTRRNLPYALYITEPVDSSPYWKDIESRIISLENQVYSTTLLDASPLLQSQFDSIVLLVVALMYTEIPPRRNTDYQSMRLIQGEKCSSCNVFDTSYGLVFRRFKSRSRDGEVALPIDDFSPRLIKALKLYFKHHPLKKQITTSAQNSPYFLVNHSGQPFIKINSITRLLEKAIKSNSQELRNNWFTRYD